MRVELELTWEDANSVKDWMDYLQVKEIDNEIIPRNFVLLFTDLVKRSIQQAAKIELERRRGNK